jgi:hypothetical protein
LLRFIRSRDILYDFIRKSRWFVSCSWHFIVKRSNFSRVLWLSPATICYNQSAQDSMNWYDSCVSGDVLWSVCWQEWRGGTFPFN